MSELAKEKLYRNELIKAGATGNNNLERIRSLQNGGGGGKVVDNGETIEDGGTIDSFTKGTAVSVGGFVYIFGGRFQNQASVYIKIYSKENKSVRTSLTSLPKNLYNLKAVAVGGFIYLFGGRQLSGDSDSSNQAIYKFNTKTEELTTLEETAYPYAVTAIGNIIYLFDGVSYTQIHEFDVTTEKRASISIGSIDDLSPNNIMVKAVGKNIYVFGNNTIYKFDTETNESTNLNIAFGITDFALSSIGGNIYIFGGKLNTELKDTIYKFDTNNEVLLELKLKMFFPIIHTTGDSIGNDICLFGGDGGSNYGYRNIFKFSVNF